MDQQNLSYIFPIGTTVDEAVRQLIRQTLQATGNNKTKAAKLLGISLKTLYTKLKRATRRTKRILHSRMENQMAKSVLCLCGCGGRKRGGLRG